MTKLNNVTEPLADHAAKLAKEVDYNEADDHMVKVIAGTAPELETPNQDQIDAAVFQHNTAVAKEQLKAAKISNDSDETRAAFNIDPKVHESQVKAGLITGTVSPAAITTTTDSK